MMLVYNFESCYFGKLFVYYIENEWWNNCGGKVCWGNIVLKVVNWIMIFIMLIFFFFICYDSLLKIKSLYLNILEEN